MGSRFKVLGHTQLLISDHFDGAWETPKARGMLAVLLLQPGRSISISELIEWVWPEGQAPKQPAATFHTYATRIRHALRHMQDPPKLHPDRGTYRIDVGQNDVDIFEFRSLVDRATLLSRQGDHALACQTLLSAMDIWSDRPLADLDGQRAKQWRHWAETDLWIPAYGDLMRELSALGEFGDVLGRLADLPIEHQTNLTVVKRRLEALHGLHRGKEAVTYFLRMRKRMIADDNRAEADELLRFHDQLQQRTRDQPRIDAASASGPADPAPPVPRLLPRDISDLVGRDDLLDRLDTIAATSSGAPLVLVHGEPGVGKTALVVHWSHRIAGRFPGGQIYLDLNGDNAGPIVSTATAVDTLLAELEFPGERISTAQGRASKLRSLLAGRRALVVLDNAASTEHVKQLVTCLPCAVVIVSRRRLSGLGRHGAETLSVPPLSYPDGRAWLAKRVGMRADQQSGSVTELASLCSGNALMLHMVAEHVRSRPRVRLSEFVEELLDEHVLLGLGEDGDNPGGSVRAAFAGSYRMLGLDERRMFTLLGVHPGPDISLDAAAALIGQSTKSTRRLLDTLVNTHLLTQPDVRDRYRLHDLLRKFAAECAAAEEYQNDRAAAAERMLNFYHHGAHNADIAVFPHRARIPLPAPHEGVSPPTFANDIAAIDWCIQERANLNSVIHYAGQHGFHSYAITAPTAVGEIFQILGYYDDIFSALSVALDSARAISDRYGQAYSLNNTGFTHLNLRHFESAESCFRMAQQLYDEAGDRLGSAVAMHNLARLHVEQGEYRRGIDGLLNALDTFRQIDAEGAEVNALFRLAEAYRRAHDLDSAISFARDGHWLAGKLADEMNRGSCLFELGAAYYDKGDLPSARGYFERGLEIHEPLHAFAQAGKASTMLSAVHRDQGSLPDAEHHAHNAVMFSRAGRDARAEAVANRMLAEILYAQARHDEAVEAWSKSLAIFEDIDDPRAEAVRSQLAELAVTLPLGPLEQTRPMVRKRQISS